MTWDDFERVLCWMVIAGSPLNRMLFVTGTLARWNSIIDDYNARWPQ